MSNPFQLDSLSLQEIQSRDFHFIPYSDPNYKSIHTACKPLLAGSVKYFKKMNDGDHVIFNPLNKKFYGFKTHPNVSMYGFLISVKLDSCEYAAYYSSPNYLVFGDKQAFLRDVMFKRLSM